MMLVTTFCDICNPKCERRQDCSYIEGDTERAVDLGWERLPDGRIACLDCLDKMDKPESKP